MKLHLACVKGLEQRVAEFLKLPPQRVMVTNRNDLTLSLSTMNGGKLEFPSAVLVIEAQRPTESGQGYRPEAISRMGTYIDMTDDGTAYIKKWLISTTFEFKLMYLSNKPEQLLDFAANWMGVSVHRELSFTLEVGSIHLDIQVTADPNVQIPQLDGTVENASPYSAVEIPVLMQGYSERELVDGSRVPTIQTVVTNLTPVIGAVQPEYDTTLQSAQPFVMAPTAALPERLQFTSDGLMLTGSGVPFSPRGWSWGHWNSAQPQDAADLVTSGGNIIRHLIRWWGFYDQNLSGIDAYNEYAPGHIDPDHLARLDLELDWLEQSGVWINLAADSNCGQNGSQSADDVAYCTLNGLSGQNFWNNLAMRQKWKELWQFLAAHVMHRKRIAWYEPLPEPAPPHFSQDDIKQFYAEMIQCIREVDPYTPIMIGGGGGYSYKNIANVYDPSFDRVVYTADMLDPVFRTTSKFNAALQNMTDLRTQHGVPIFVNQGGILTSNDPDSSILLSRLRTLNSANVGYAVWEYRDKGSANAYGGYYQDTNGNWIAKPNVLSAASTAFRGL